MSRNPLICALGTKRVIRVGLGEEPHKASSYEKDVYLNNDELMNPGVIGPDYKMAFPIDTQVVNVAHKLKLELNTDDPEQIRSYFIERCGRLNIDPLKVAAGLWYLGSHSLDILVEHLEEIDIKVAGGQ